MKNEVIVVIGGVTYSRDEEGFWYKFKPLSERGDNISSIWEYVGKGLHPEDEKRKSLFPEGEPGADMGYP